MSDFERGSACGHAFFAQVPGMEREQIEWEAVGVLVHQDGSRIEFDSFVDGFIEGYFLAATEAIERLKADFKEVL